jgi:hypothetical protein
MKKVATNVQSTEESLSQESNNNFTFSPNHIICDENEDSMDCTFEFIDKKKSISINEESDLEDLSRDILNKNIFSENYSESKKINNLINGYQ